MRACAQDIKCVFTAYASRIKKYAYSRGSGIRLRGVAACVHLCSVNDVIDGIDCSVYIIYDDVKFCSPSSGVCEEYINSSRNE